MANVDPKLARTITWVAGIVATMVTITLPLGYFLVSYHSQTAALETEAEINSRIASEVINANPEMWRFQDYKLAEFLSRRPRHGYAEVRRILDNENKVIAESIDTLPSPMITRTAPLLDSGVSVGRIEISRSLRPLLVQTGEVMLLGLILSWAAFIALRVLPLRALDRALEDNYRLLGETKRNLEQIRVLHEIDRAITSTLDLRGVLEVLLEKIDLVLPNSVTTIRLFNRDTGQLEPVACRNLDETEWRAAINGADNTLSRAFHDIKAPLMIRNAQTDPRALAPDFLRQHSLVSALRVPLIAKGEVLGVLTFFTKEEHEFSNGEVEFLSTLATQAAIAIHNAQLYEETTKLASNLGRSNSVKDEFLSVMSHELRTPLNVVMGYAAMMKDGMLGDVNSKQNDALGKILGRVNDQIAMINNILYATSIEATKIPVERHVVILADLFNDLESAYHAQATGPDLTLNWDCPPDLPILETDRAKLKQILQNLIDNAIKFTAKGKISISARHNLEAKTIELQVADTGLGIPRDMIAAIFEKFRQVDSSETRPYGGVGMGLYIVKSFTEMLAGKIDVESEFGKGSTFTIHLPLRTH